MNYEHKKTAESSAGDLAPRSELVIAHGQLLDADESGSGSGPRSDIEAQHTVGTAAAKLKEWVADLNRNTQSLDSIEDADEIEEAREQIVEAKQEFLPFAVVDRSDSEEDNLRTATLCGANSGAPHKVFSDSERISLVHEIMGIEVEGESEHYTDEDLTAILNRREEAKSEGPCSTSVAVDPWFEYLKSLPLSWKRTLALMSGQNYDLPFLVSDHPCHRMSESLKPMGFAAREEACEGDDCVRESLIEEREDAHELNATGNAESPRNRVSKRTRASVQVGHKAERKKNKSHSKVTKKLGSESVAKGDKQHENCTSKVPKPGSESRGILVVSIEPDRKEERRRLIFFRRWRSRKTKGEAISCTSTSKNIHANGEFKLASGNTVEKCDNLETPSRSTPPEKQGKEPKRWERDKRQFSRRPKSMARTISCGIDDSGLLWSGFDFEQREEHLPLDNAIQDAEDAGKAGCFSSLPVFGCCVSSSV